MTNFSQLAIAVLLGTQLSTAAAADNWDGGYYYHCDVPSEAYTTYYCDSATITGSDTSITRSAGNTDDTYSTIVYSCPDGYEAIDPSWEETSTMNVCDAFSIEDGHSFSDGYRAATLHAGYCTLDSTYTLETFGCSKRKRGNESITTDYEYTCPQPTGDSTSTDEWTCYNEALDYPDDADAFFTVTVSDEDGNIEFAADDIFTFGYFCPDGYTVTSPTFRYGNDGEDKQYLEHNDIYTADYFAGQSWGNTDTENSRKALLYSFGCTKDDDTETTDSRELGSATPQPTGYYYYCAKQSEGASTWYCGTDQISGSVTTITYNEWSVLPDTFATIIYQCPDGYKAFQPAWEEDSSGNVCNVFSVKDDHSFSNGYRAGTLLAGFCETYSAYTLREFGCKPESNEDNTVNTDFEYTCDQPDDSPTEWTCYNPNLYPMQPGEDFTYFSIAESDDNGEITVDADSASTIGYFCPEGYTVTSPMFDNTGNDEAESAWLENLDVYTASSFAAQSFKNTDADNSHMTTLYTFGCKQDDDTTDSRNLQLDVIPNIPNSKLGGGNRRLRGAAP